MKKTGIYLYLMIVAAAIAVTGCRKKQPAENGQTAQAPKTEKQPSAQAPKTENDLPAEPGGTIDLEILYAGRPGSDREKDFTAFLSKHFAKVTFTAFLSKHFAEVTTCDLAEFTDARAEAVDVVVFDYDGKGFDAPMPDISEDYSTPTITLGVVGAIICRELGLATGYM